MEREAVEAPEGFRLSPQQLRLWAEGGRHRGNWQKTVIAIGIDGEAEAPAPSVLRAAIEHASARHEILRTRFVTPPGSRQPLQVIGEASVEWLGEEVASAANERIWLEEIFERAAALPLDPVAGPVIHAWISRFGSSRALALALPALIVDRAAGFLLAGEIASGVADTEARAEDDPLQYADLAEWQHALLESEEASAGRSYWESLRWRELDAVPLPFGAAGFGGGFVPRFLTRRVASTTAERLAAVASSLGVSLRALWLSLWQLLLARQSGVSTFSLGVSYDGRRFDDLGSAIGPFARTLPFSSQLDPDSPWTDTLGAVAARVENADRDCGRWQENFDVEAALDAPFGRVRFDFFNAGSGGPFHKRASGFRWATVRSVGERFALGLEVRVEDQQVFEIQADAGLFGSGEIEILAARLERLVEAVASDAGRELGEYEILPETERRLLAGGFDPRVSMPAIEPSVVSRFAEQAARTPQSIAVADGTRELTYAELGRRSELLARYLRSLGIGTDSRVAVFLDRSVDLVAAILGILRAGAAFVALDPVFPRDRLALMLAESRARMVLTVTDLAGALPEGIDRLDLDRSAEEIAQAVGSDLPHIEPESLAYVIFTSGSTGKPKAVGVEHRQLASYTHSILSRLDLPEGSSFATVSGFAADLGYTAVFPAVTSGGRLQMISAELAADSARLASFLRLQPVDVLKITPSHFSALAASARLAELMPRKRLVLGGETLTWEIAERLVAGLRTCTVLNHYGPTEATVGVCTYRVTSRATAPLAASVPIGRPLDHARILVLDPLGGDLTPIGSIGEVFVSGACARGYLEDPAATAERFVPDAYSSEPGARLYRTGDRGRWHATGDLEFLGRMDGQLKIRGFRVEPGEIEKLLERHPAVRAACVVGREESRGDLSLAAYVAVDTAAASPIDRLVRLRAEGRLDDQALFELPNGLTIAHLNEGETRFLFHELFEQRTYLQHGIEIGEGACVVDVGASIGMFSLFASMCAKNVRVLAFEPVPAVFRALRLNSEIYGGPAAIRAFDVGLSRVNGSAELTFYPHLTLMSSLYGDPSEEREVVRSFLQQDERTGELPSGSMLEELLESRLESRSIPVSLRRLSDVLREEGIERIDLLKIDAQKAERDVLAGIDEEDWPRIRQVVLEVHDLDGRLSEIVAFLEERGFAVAVEQERILANTPLFDVFARRPETGPEAPGAPSERLETAWSSPSRLIAELRRHLQASLPEPMVPATFSLLAEFPLTSNGKLNRGALPPPETLAFNALRPIESPRTPTELKLAEIWKDILPSARFGIHDAFFEVGGHSLLATQVVARIRNEFQVELTLRDFFNEPTIAATARRVEEAEPLAASNEERINRLVRSAFRQGRQPLV